MFDVSQTDGEPLPAAPEHNATEGGDDVLPMLESAAAAFGIRVLHQDIAGSVEGLSIGETVIVKASHPVPAKCGTLAHEIAHELLHKGVDRGTSSSVIAHFGMPSGSRFYLHGTASRAICSPNPCSRLLVRHDALSSRSKAQPARRREQRMLPLHP